MQQAAAGRKSLSKSRARGGRYVRAEPLQPGQPASDIAIDATLRAALRRRLGEDRLSDADFRVTPADLHRKVRQRLRNSLVVFVVDASESMGAATERRMAAAKGAVLALLTSAYQKRDRVAVISFRDREADILLSPTNSVARAREKLQRLPTGGATPLADGLFRAWELIKVERSKDPDIQPMMVILSDGEANVPMTEGAPVIAELMELAGRIAKDGIHTLAIDTKSLSAKTREMKQLAEALKGRYHHILQLKAGSVVDIIRQDTWTHL